MAFVLSNIAAAYDLFVCTILELLCTLSQAITFAISLRPLAALHCTGVNAKINADRDTHFSNLKFYSDAVAVKRLSFGKQMCVTKLACFYLSITLFGFGSCVARFVYCIHRHLFDSPMCIPHPLTCLFCREWAHGSLSHHVNVLYHRNVASFG